jgi:hypothetical protein
MGCLPSRETARHETNEAAIRAMCDVGRTISAGARRTSGPGYATLQFSDGRSTTAAS